MTREDVRRRNELAIIGGKISGWYCAEMRRRTEEKKRRDEVMSKACARAQRAAGWRPDK